MDSSIIIRAIDEGKDLVLLDCSEAPAVSQPGWTFDSGILRMDTKTFVESETEIRKLPIQGGIFVSCPPLKSSQELAMAAARVARNWEAVAIYHNRDQLSDLLDMFPHAREMLLPHNLVLPVEGDSRKISRLRELCGSCIGISNSLMLSTRMSLQLILRCQQVQAVAADLRGMQIYLNQPSFLTGVTLGIHGFNLETGKVVVMTEASPACVAAAAILSPRLLSLKMTVRSLDALSRLDLFSAMTTLDVVFTGEERCSFDDTVGAFVEKRALVSLSLCRFDAVRLSVIVKHCPRLSELVLKDCTMVEEQLPSYAFSNLQTLYLTEPISGTMLSTVVASCSSAFVELGLGGAEMCGYFLGHDFDKSRCTSLETLALKSRCSCDVTALQKLLLHCKCLKAVQTDSEELRSFFEANAPEICLLRTTCATCKTEFPKLNDVKQDFWKNVGII
ncbi:uncharacterized protein LOC135400140 [Ornithodoros turicata]|uniref:uncharacterized protein LOC135400140 n=1 Tax=Ornithodoros turicata TaxID=34597 RepID=UPI003138BEF5